ncbi:amidohydrolase [Leucobacter chinensis]|uniref:amidohydrolase n=1 Tax=Leucobacter chinensis TaxID=2851010 RepID=UPI001C21D65F|nr:amidohydrolase family protein [Leucobacter chinensis]
MNAEMLLRAAKVISPGDGDTSLATHVSIADGRIRAIGGVELEQLEHDEVLDFAGATVMPGLVDVHTHPVWGSAAQGGGVGCAEASTLDALRALLEAAARADGEGWISGHDLDVSVFPGGIPDGRVFEQWLPGRKIVLMTRDAHALVVSPAVVAELGLTGEETFADTSEIVCDGHGVTGWVVELQAMDLVLDQAPAVPLNVHAEYLLETLESFAAAGLTEIHALDFHEPSRELFTAIERDRELPLRVRAFPLVPADSSAVEWREIAALQGQQGRRWSVDGAKFMLDGTADNGTAWFETPDCLGENQESLWRNPEAYREAIRFFTAQGVPTATHAIGDRAVRFALEVLAEAGPVGATPHRIEHIESIPDDLVHAFAEAGVVASLQPTHATRLTQPDQSDNWSKRIGADRVAQGWRVKDLCEAGAVVVLSSDWPIGVGDPRVSLADAQVRRPVEEERHTPHQPTQAISALEAYTAMTLGPARAGGVAETRGRVRAGMVADLVVFEQNPLDLTPREQSTNAVLATFVGGERSANRVGTQRVETSPTRNSHGEYR